jgi:uncharacterized protein YabN with tetrapyrrole methylase and pyrophosphatase domain
MKKLNIVGSGMNMKDDFTLGALEAIKKSDISYYVDSFDPELVENYNVSSKKIFDLNDLYVDGDIDMNNYQRIFKHVINSFKSHNIITFIVGGHPRVGVSLTDMFEEYESNEISIEVFNGISSFNGMFNDLKTDPLETGSVILDVNRLLLFEHEINPYIDLYLYHICSVGNSRTNFEDHTINNKIFFLESYLKKFYDKEHIVKIISCSNQGRKAEINELKLSELGNRVDLAHFGTSLYIKAKKPNKYNSEYYSLIYT